MQLSLPSRLLLNHFYILVVFDFHNYLSDTNGWCPFCERVWLAIRAKELPYDEVLVSLQNKPDWYKKMVPTALVPAVLFHEGCLGGDETKPPTERKVVWESSSILQQLDDLFPETPQLMKYHDPEFQKAMELHERLQTAGLQFAYGGRNQTLTEQEKNQRRANFEQALDDLDAAFSETQQKEDGSGGGFRLGKEFSGIDAIMIPTLERWRYQLPITEDFDILKNRRNLQHWFDTMDSFEPYSSRVAGDEYSWTATASMFLRYFGGGEDKPNVAAGIKRADAAAISLGNKFASHDGRNDERKYTVEAVTKLISNHEAVVKDCVMDDPLSQKHISRASNREVADTVLRYAASILVSVVSSETQPNMPSIELAKTAPLVAVTDKDEGALALRTVANRLCVPRDMGAPSAAILRGVLSIVADRLDSSS
jgi:glutathione S-transferase